MTPGTPARDVRGVLARERRPDERVLDDVYRRYASSDPFIPVVQFIDHATMGSEALVGLGLGHKVPEWISRHRVRPYTAPRTGISIEANWKQALGRRECHGDWLGFFDAELANAPPHDVLRRWVPRFAHAVEAFLFHGLIRTAHALRALDHVDTPARRGELARGLALWAIGVKRAPSDGGAEGASDGDAGQRFVHFARAGAATFIVDSTIPNLHLVTGPMAFMMLRRHLDPSVHRVAARSFERTHAKAVRELDRLRAKTLSEAIPTLDEEFLDFLARERDAHPAKLTEAALRGYEETSDEIFLRAIGKVRHLHRIRNLLGVARAVMRRAG